MDVPENLLYTKDHEWASVENDLATIGVTRYAVDELGDIVYVELPETGDPIEQNKVFGTVESVKAVAELFAPLSGEVEDVNSDLQDAPETTNDDPYGDAWMIKIRLSELSELENLMSAEEYDNYLSEIS